MSNFSKNANSVRVTQVVTGDDEKSHFNDYDVPLKQQADTPFLVSDLIPSTAISFRWTPHDYTSDFHHAPRHRLLIVLSGRIEIEVPSGDVRKFECGDLLEVCDTWGYGHISRSGSSKPVRTAIINLDGDLVTPRDIPFDAKAESGESELSIRRTFADDDGVSDTVEESLAILNKGPSGRLTFEEPINGFQYVVAPAEMAYDWHQAPQKQYVLPLTGGMEVENGKGTRHTIKPGDIYRGEDTHGPGHITRALNGERLSIFAHLV